MAPRHEEEANTVPATLSDLSLLDIKPYEHYMTGDLAASVEKPMKEKNALGMETSLRDCLKQLAEVAAVLSSEMNANGSIESRSPTMAACKGSLSWEFAAMMSEADVLLQSLDKEELMVTPWRVSLLQARIHSYLAMIHRLMNGVDRKKLDSELLRILGPVLESTAEEKTADFPVRISSWRTPSLAFDVELANPVHYTHAASPPSNKCDFDYQLPMKVHVKVITDIMAKDIETGAFFACEPCSLHLERCRHEATTTTNNLGIVAEAMLELRICPKGDRRPRLDYQDWVVDGDLMRVDEARVVQTNAFPPEPKTVADIYTGSIHGSMDATVSLRFKTYKTQNNETPEFIIELLVGGCKF